MPSAPSIVQILWRYKNHENLSDGEMAELRRWLEESSRHEDLFDDLSNSSKWDKEVEAVISKDSDPTWFKIQAKIEALSGQKNVKKMSWQRFTTIAASVLLVCILTIFWYYKTNHQPEPLTLKTDKNIEVYPSASQVTLVLDNGNTVRLDSANRGKVALEDGILISKTDSASISYLTVAGISKQVKYNSLITGKGSQIQLKLPDGSKVWLNSGSVLRYPVEFLGPNRSVELTGEAYFEVAKKKEKPFIVRADQSEVRVLGTKFDIKAYPGEKLQTVLVEGSVLFSMGKDSVCLKPGMEAQISKQGFIIVDSANLPQALAWRSRLFWFSQTPLNEMMTEISREYDVDVQYKGSSENSFTGILPQNLALSGLLDMIEKGGNIHFSREGKKVTVRP